MTYSNDFLEQIRAACPMETIAGNYVNLIRRGRHYVCNCPFHSEKSPSCTIFPETQSFYCFGCGAGGDVITWVRRMDNLEFTDAVKQLAERCGLQVPTDREATAVHISAPACSQSIGKLQISISGISFPAATNAGCNISFPAS